MKKTLIGVALAVVVLALFFGLGGKKGKSTNDDVVYRNTISISRAYVALRVKTNKLLTQAQDYPDYKTWNKEMTELIENWENLDLKAVELEEQAGILLEEKVSFKIVNEAHAFTKDEISNVFDKAPAGKKIKTLAKYLGVDAKRAFKILKTDQEFVKADAWNEAGDTFKKLEVSAILIKDGCKVAGFIGAAAMTGGASATASLGSAGIGAGLVGGTATLAEGTIMIVTGTDLILEISEDAATISLGDDNKVVKTISKIRSVTDPAASLLSLKDIPKNVAKGAAFLDKVGVVLVQVDQARSMIQDGKLLGINITPDAKIEIAAIEEGEVEKWIEEYEKEQDEIMDDVSDDIDEWLEEFEDMDDWMDEFEEEEELEEEALEEEEATEEEEIDEEQETDDDTRVMEDSTIDDYAEEMLEKMNKGLLTDTEWEEALEKIEEMNREENEREEEEREIKKEENFDGEETEWEEESDGEDEAETEEKIERKPMTEEEIFMEKYRL